MGNANFNFIYHLGKLYYNELQKLYKYWYTSISNQNQLVFNVYAYIYIFMYFLVNVRNTYDDFYILKFYFN